MSDYDWETAQALFRSRRYVYCIFMCHLAIEKSLKGLYWERKAEYPPRTHNLLYFVKELTLPLPQDLLEFLGKINDASVVARYPEDLQKVVKAYPRSVTKEYLQKTREVLEWIRKQFAPSSNDIGNNS